MGKFEFKKCADIEGLYVVQPYIYEDERGYNFEAYNESDFKQAGLDMKFVQDNRSTSIKGVLRGLHFQRRYQQGKLVSVIRGKVFDVAVDIRKGSKTFGKWYGLILSAENRSTINCHLCFTPPAVIILYDVSAGGSRYAESELRL